MSGLIGHTMYGILARHEARARGLPIAGLLARHEASYLCGACSRRIAATSPPTQKGSSVSTVSPTVPTDPCVTPT